CSPCSPLFPYTTLFRSLPADGVGTVYGRGWQVAPTSRSEPPSWSSALLSARSAATWTRWLPEGPGSSGGGWCGGSCSEGIRCARSEEHTSELQSLAYLV